MAREMFPGVFARQCPDCGMYCGKGAATDLQPPCKECLAQRIDCLALYGAYYVLRQEAA